MSSSSSKTAEWITKINRVKTSIHMGMENERKEARLRRYTRNAKNDTASVTIDGSLSLVDLTVTEAYFEEATGDELGEIIRALYNEARADAISAMTDLMKKKSRNNHA